MSFNPPNHARALSLALFFTWLYIGSALWYDALTTQSVDLFALVEGTLGVGLLTYGTLVVHRLFFLNGLPLVYRLCGAVWNLPATLDLLFHGASVIIILGSLLVVFWVFYHARRDSITVRVGMQLAFLFAVPILLYEMSRRVWGLDVFDFVVDIFYR
ncbi:MAG: hypothetical protein HOC74_18350 [Gemmatimonadetes bacterium]|jgi:hypothetical protein|nr:hypothetical protein [Gemmatimonadota bacterium]